MVGKRAPTVERFWSKVLVKGPEECWPWTGHTNGVGYGMLWNPEAGRKVLATRFSCELHHGPMPPRSLACHHCDNPACVNPKHLYIGDYRRNMRDALERGRHGYGRPKRHADGTLMHPPPVFHGDDHPWRKNPALVPRGESVGTAKLTAEDVALIYSRRMAGENVRTIARSVKMDHSTIADICNGKRWAHLLGVNGNPTLADLRAMPKGTAPTLLDETAVRAIRADFAAGMSGVDVAAKHRITKQTASEIRTYKTWRNVT